MLMDVWVWGLVDERMWNLDGEYAIMCNNGCERKMMNMQYLISINNRFNEHATFDINV